MTHINQWQDIAPGIRRKVMPPGEQLMSILIELKQGALGPEHSHPHEQITFVVSGSVEMIIEGKHYILKEHDQVRVPGNAMHSLKTLEDSVLLEAFTPLRDDLLGRD